MPPQLFAGTRLVKRWKEGLVFGVGLREMADCPRCQSGDLSCAHNF